MNGQRKPRTPRPVISDPLSLLRPASKERAGDVMLHFYTALECIARSEHPGEAEWRSLADAVNTLETMVLRGKFAGNDAAEIMALVNRAIEAMALAAKRFRLGRGLRFGGPAMQTMRDVVWFYGECLTAFSEREMALAQQHTQRRMHALLADPNPNKEGICI